jgi:1-acyl-sn-glycerol-3-phosphate acyltransferase
MLYEVAKPIVHVVLRAVYSPRIVGVQHIPDHGAAVLASSHLSGADTVFMPAQVRRTVHFLAKSDFFSGTTLPSRAFGRLMRSLGVMPLDRAGGSASEAAIRGGLEVLRDGGLLGIYPEGTRSPDGRLHRGKTGAARLAIATGAPIIPIGMEGSFEAQRGRRIVPRRRPRIVIRVGAAIDPAEVVGDLEAARTDPVAARELTDVLMARIQELTGQDYVDVYAADVKAALARGEDRPPASPGPGRPAAEGPAGS